MQKNNKYLSLLAITGVAASFTFTLPVFAGTDANAAQAPGNWRGGQENRQPGVFGKVAAISGTTITITESRANKTYTIDASGATFTKGGTVSSISDIAAGDMIMAEGTISGTSVAASKINSGDMGRGSQDEKGRGIMETVSSISGNTIIVAGKTGGPGAKNNTETVYTVDAGNAAVKKDGADSAVSSIAVGDTLMIRGTIDGTNIAATSIDDGMPGKGQGSPQNQGARDPIVEGDGQPMIAGTVISVSGSTFTVTNKGNNTYEIDASGATIKKDGVENATVSNIAAGDQIVAQGAVNGTSMTASSVIDQGGKDSSAGSSTEQSKAGFFGRIFSFLKSLFGF